MLRLQRGDTGAFEELVAHYQGIILNLIVRFMGRRGSREDLAQEVFLRVFRARRDYRPEARFSTWLYRIVFNLCINENQRDRRRRTVSLDGAADGRDGSWDPVDPAGLPPEGLVESEELHERVRAVVAELPESQRVALVLDKYEGLSQREIAAVLGTTEKAVKSLLARARDNVRDRLMPYLRRAES
ncbi:MAG: sigma-70 family RNA polymerase sigma factor [Planctomycetes bacterium]|nr:sigma-70 family RNA polymerase sigma factor [Planctomycetota bacterium]